MLGPSGGNYVQEVVFNMKAAYDARASSAAFAAMVKAAEDANAHIQKLFTFGASGGSGAGFGGHPGGAHAGGGGGRGPTTDPSGIPRDVLQWGAQLSKQLDKQLKERERYNQALVRDEEKLQRDLDRVRNKWMTEQNRREEQRQAQIERRQEQAVRRSTQLSLSQGRALGLYGADLLDSSLSFGKALSLGSLVTHRSTAGLSHIDRQIAQRENEQADSSLASSALKIHAGFEAARSGLGIVQSGQHVLSTLHEIGRGGPATFGRAIQSATDSALLGHLAWRAGATGTGRSLIGGIGRFAGAASSGLGALGGFAMTGVGAATLGGAGLAAGLGISYYDKYQRANSTDTDYRPSKARQFFDPLEWGDWHTVEQQDRAIERGQLKRQEFLSGRDQMEGNQRAELAAGLEDRGLRMSIATSGLQSRFAAESFGRTEGQQRDARERFIAGSRGVLGAHISGLEGELKQAGSDPQQRLTIERQILQARQQMGQLDQQAKQVSLERLQAEKQITQQRAASFRADASADRQANQGRAAAAGAGFAGIGQMHAGQQKRIRDIYAKAKSGTPLNRHEREAALESGIPDLVNEAKRQATDAGKEAVPEAAADVNRSFKIRSKIAAGKERQAHAEDQDADSIDKEMAPIREELVKAAQELARSLVESADAIKAAKEEVRNRNANPAPASNESAAYSAQIHQSAVYG